MFSRFTIVLLSFLTLTAGAQDSAEIESERDPAAATATPTKRNYPGGADEEDLRVQAQLPEAAIKVDARSVQKNVFREMFNQELKDERSESMEE